MFMISFNLYSFKFGESMLNDKYQLTISKFIYGYMVECDYDTGYDNDEYYHKHILGSVEYKAVRVEDRYNFMVKMENHFLKIYKSTMKVPKYLTISSNLYDMYFKYYFKTEAGISIKSAIEKFEIYMNVKVDGIMTLYELYLFDNSEKNDSKVIILPVVKMANRYKNFKKFMDRIKSEYK